MIRARWKDAEQRTAEAVFSTSFRVGRQPECEVCLPFPMVSRTHAEIAPTDDGWRVTDLDSSNGVFLNGTRVTEAKLPPRCAIRFGEPGPTLELELVAKRPEPAAPQPPGWGVADAQSPIESDARAPVGRSQAVGARERGPEAEGRGYEGPRHRQASQRASHRQDVNSIEEAIEKYTREDDDESVGDHTRFVRAAVRQVRQKQKRSFRLILAGLFLCIFALGSYAIYEMEFNEPPTRELAINIFYQIKTLELELARLEGAVVEAAVPEVRRRLEANLQASRQRFAELQADYARYLEDTDLADPAVGDVDRLILRVAQLFGECGLNVPPEFSEEVKKYIRFWQNSDRLEAALAVMRGQNYGPVIFEALAREGLPPHFLYLALQESNFNLRAVGPWTRFGIAKGMWQFIPATGERYGLRIGPLAGERRYDPDDERFDFEAATRAAARYLSDIYETEAQASGLLVMASYNYGERRVVDKIRSMPENPRDRNFWNLLKHHQIPKETYDYVFYIFSAAVIGENPNLFGFDFASPLADQ